MGKTKRRNSVPAQGASELSGPGGEGGVPGPLPSSSNDGAGGATGTGCTPAKATEQDVKKRRTHNSRGSDPVDPWRIENPDDWSEMIGSLKAWNIKGPKSDPIETAYCRAIQALYTCHNGIREMAAARYALQEEVPVKEKENIDGTLEALNTVGDGLVSATRQVLSQRRERKKKTQDVGLDPIRDVRDSGTDPMDNEEEMDTDPERTTRDVGTDPVSHGRDLEIDPIPKDIRERETQTKEAGRDFHVREWMRNMESKLDGVVTRLDGLEDTRRRKDQNPGKEGKKDLQGREEWAKVVGRRRKQPAKEESRTTPAPTEDKRRCYRCLCVGHIWRLCTSNTDRSSRCYRCGAQGHVAAGCSAGPNCPLCVDMGRPARHRLGSKGCLGTSQQGAREPGRGSGGVCPTKRPRWRPPNGEGQVSSFRPSPG